MGSRVDGQQDSRHWTLSFLAKQTDEKIGLFLLNTPLPTKPELFKRLWAAAAYKAVVDGGANELYGCGDLDPRQYIPDVITGDLDSARPEVLEHYAQQGCPIVRTPDQNFTDFTKSMKHVLQHIRDSQLQVSCLVAYVGIYGRFDHVCANVNSLFEGGKLTELPLYLVSNTSLTCLLPQGSHVIHVDPELQGDWCGLIPIGCPCDHVTTTGLKWNLSDSRMEFGGIVSTSNTFDGSSTVTVETDQPLVWTMALP